MPLLIRGPGIPQGVSVDELAINADLAPTILDATGRRGPASRSTAARCCRSPSTRRRLRGRELLIEQAVRRRRRRTANGVFYNALRNSRYTYVEQRKRRDRALRPRARSVPARQPHANPAYDEAEAALAARLARAAGLRRAELPAQAGAEAEAAAPGARGRTLVPRGAGHSSPGSRRGGRPVVFVRFRVGAKRRAGGDQARRSRGAQAAAAARASAGRRCARSPSSSTAASVSLQKRVRICR